MHEAPANARSEEESIVYSFTLHCKRLLPRLELMTFTSHKSNFTDMSRLPF